MASPSPPISRCTKIGIVAGIIFMPLILVFYYQSNALNLIEKNASKQVPFKEHNTSLINYSGHISYLSLEQVVNIHKKIQAEYFDFFLTILPSERQILLDLAEKFSSVCKSLKITYFMYGGTLLGSYRHHDFIPWDDDVDVIAPMKYYNTIYDALKKLKGYQVVKNKNVRLKFYSEKSQYKTRTWKWPFIDICFYEANDTHIWDTSIKEFPTQTFNKDVIFPVHDRPFAGLILKSPKDAFAYLKKTYSDVGCSRKSYSHQHEAFIRATGNIPCERLIESLPFIHRRRTRNGVMETLAIGSEILYSAVVDEPTYAITKPYKLQLV